MGEGGGRAGGRKVVKLIFFAGTLNRGRMVIWAVEGRGGGVC